MSKSTKSSLYEFTVKRKKRSFAHEGVKLDGPEAAVRFLQRLCKSLDREHFFALHLDCSGAVIGFETVAIGGLASVEVHPREVFKGAIVSGAFAIVVAHNHPSGNPEPSDGDMALTLRLKEAGELLGIEVLDSLVLAGSQFYSMAAQEAK